MGFFSFNTEELKIGDNLIEKDLGSIKKDI